MKRRGILTGLAALAGLPVAKLLPVEAPVAEAVQPVAALADREVLNDLIWMIQPQDTPLLSLANVQIGDDDCYAWQDDPLT